MRDTRASVAVLAAVGLLALGTATGVGIDYARGLNFKSALQAAADSAAIAGATAYTSSSTSTNGSNTASNYMTAAASGLPTNNGVASKVSTSSSSTGYSVKVTASATIDASFTGLIMNSIPVSVTATAINPIVTVSFNLGNFSSSAWDANTVYYYLVPSDGSLPTTSELIKVWSNTTTSNPAPASVSVASTQLIGFMLKNVTGGITGYGSNGYGAAQGSTHKFYSQNNPVSEAVYSSVKQDCSLKTNLLTSSTASWPTVAGGCLTSNPSYSTVNCASVGSQAVLYSWNDMGGGTDDLDYNDAQYTFACSGVTSGAPTEVYLTN